MLLLRCGGCASCAKCCENRHAYPAGIPAAFPTWLRTDCGSWRRSLVLSQPSRRNAAANRTRPITASSLSSPSSIFELLAILAMLSDEPSTVNL
jgi:hypothetical protein